MILKPDQIKAIRDTYGESAYYDRMKDLKPVPEDRAKYFGKTKNGRSIAERLQAATLGDTTESRRYEDVEKQKAWVKKMKREGRMDPNEMHSFWGMNRYGMPEEELI